MGDEDLRLLPASNQQNNAGSEQSSMQQPSTANAAGMEEGKSNNDVTLDPWALYGGNIAAACRATNSSVTEQEAHKGDDIDTDAEKHRQRASSRLTAWQSRERKRIEFEVLQERKEELNERNLRLERENEHIKVLIEQLKAAPDLFGTDAVNLYSPRFAPHAGSPLVANRTNISSGSALLPMNSSFSSSTAPSRAAATSSFNPSLVAANLARMQHTAPQQESLLFPLYHHHGTSSRPCSFFPGTTTRTSSNSSSSVRRGGLADAPSRPPSLLLSAAQNTRLPIQRYLGGNDIIAPTVFAPLQRGGQQQHQCQPMHEQYHQQQQQQQHLQQGMHFASGLPFNLSSLMTHPPSDGAIDVPLFRTVHQQKRKGESSQKDAKQAPTSKKQRATLTGGGEERKPHDHVLLSPSPLASSPGASVDS
jgi:hypothetical protein